MPVPRSVWEGAIFTLTALSPKHGSGGETTVSPGAQTTPSPGAVAAEGVTRNVEGGGASSGGTVAAPRTPT